MSIPIAPISLPDASCSRIMYLTKVRQFDYSPVVSTIGREYPPLYPELAEDTMPRIHDVYLGSVVYVYPSVSAAKRGDRVGGSGVLIASRLSPRSRYAQLYVVTNRHVVRGLNSKVIALRFNAIEADTRILQTLRSDWILDEADDLAVLSLDLSNSDCEGAVIPDGMFLSEGLADMFHIGPGDETFMIGRLITHDGKQRNTPVVRFGNISMMPNEPIRTSEGTQYAFLVECRSLSGFSGSPVFVWQPYFDRPGPHGPWLLGINCGHMTLPESVRTLSGGKRIRVEESSAIEVAVPAWSLKRFLYQDSLVEARLKVEKEVENKERLGFVAFDTAYELSLQKRFRRR